MKLLNEYKADYLIVGGYAVGIHGHPRYTGDLDIWLKISEENAIKLIQVVKDFGFGSFGLTVDDFLKVDNIIQLGYPPLRIDLLTQIDGVNFTEAYKNKKVIDIEELKVNFIGYQDLVKNKKATGRLRDLDDIENMKE